MHRILIVRACAVGDFVLNLPALQALDESAGLVEFTLVGYPSTLELARDFVRVEAIHSIDNPPWSDLFHSPIPNLSFDSAVVWMKDPSFAQNLRDSGISGVVRADPFPHFGHAADHLLRTLRLPRPPLPDLWQPQTSDIILHPTSGSSQKCWPYFHDLTSRLSNAVILLGPGSSPFGKGIRALRDLTLPEVFHYLRTSSAYIGNDSGITHLAAYLGCPTIALFGPTDPRTWGPIGRRSRIIWRSKLEDISVDEVLLAASKIKTSMT